MTSTRAAARVAAALPNASNLDERVLSAGTTQRFFLLIVLFVAESAGAAYDVALRLADASGSQHDAILTAVSYVVPAALVLAAVRVYRKLPAWKGRAGRAVALGEIWDDGRLRRDLDALVRIAGLKTSPRFVFDPGATTASAVVFGTGSDPTVRLNGGLVVLHATNRERFRAIVLHELAHIHNRDVGITYATVAMWRVLLFAALLPDVLLITLTGFSGSSAHGAGALVQEAVIVALAYATRADILRTREIYADRTAVRLWGVRPDALLPGGDESPRDQSRSARLVSTFAEVWRTHPSWRLRRRSLSAPDVLFVQRGMPMLITGLAADIASTQLTAPFGSTSSWLGMMQYLLISGLVMGVGGVALWRAIVHTVLTGRPVPSGLVAGLWLGAGLAAGELTNSKLHEGRLLPAHPEFFLVLVVVVVLLMAWTAQFAQLRIRTYRGESLNVAMGVGLIAPSLALAFTLLWWNKGGWVTGWHFSVSDTLAHAELPVADAPGLLRMTAVLTNLPGSDLGLSGLWWAVPFLWLLPLQLWLARLPRSLPGRLTRFFLALSERKMPKWLLVLLVPLAFAGLFLFLALVSTGPAGFFVLALLIWLGILALVRAFRENRESSYWLDQAQPGSRPPTMDAPELGWVARLGALGGLVCCLGLLAQPAVTHSARAFGSWQVDSNVDVAWTVLVISAVMVVVAAVTAIVARGRYWLITALIAAGLAAVIGLAGEYLKGTVDGCLGPLSTMTSTCRWEPIRFMPLTEYALGYVLAPGLLIAALAAAGAHAARSLVRRRVDAAAPTAPRSGRAGEAAGPRELARPMVTVGFLNAVAICLVASTSLYQAFVMVAPLPQRALMFEYAVSPTGHIRVGVSPLAEWMRYTADTFRAYGSSLETIADAADGLKGEDPADVAHIAETLPPACRSLADLGQHAEENARLYNPAVPVEADRLWSRFVDGVRTTATHCAQMVRATTDAEIEAALTTLNTDATTTTNAARALTEWGARKSGNRS